MSNKRTKTGIAPSAQAPEAAALLRDVRQLIEAGRAHIAQAVNAGMVLLRWSIGDHIRRDILGERRAKYGEAIVAALLQQLTAEYGRGFGRANLFRAGMRSPYVRPLAVFNG